LDRLEPALLGAPQSADQLLNAAYLAAPHARVDSIAFPSRPTGAAAVSMSVGHDPALGPLGQGDNQVAYLDAYTGHLLQVAGASDHSVSGQLYEYWAFRPMVECPAGRPHG
jgi:hypothetical protein